MGVSLLLYPYNQSRHPSFREIEALCKRNIVFKVIAATGYRFIAPSSGSWRTMVLQWKTCSACAQTSKEEGLVYSGVVALDGRKS
jgi:hypothetical protein